MKVLLILRHAKSSWSDNTLSDHQRPLNKRGQRDAPRLGTLLREQHLVPDLIVSSDAVRTRLTVEALTDAAGYTGTICYDRLLYLASPQDIVAVLRTIDEAHSDTVMIVGHNPGLEDLLAHLTREQHDLPTATLAHISLPIRRWRDLDIDTRGALLAVWRPEDLK